MTLFPLFKLCGGCLLITRLVLRFSLIFLVYKTLLYELGIHLIAAFHHTQEYSITGI